MSTLDTQLLAMCRDVLSDGDLRTIGKARGFPAKVSESRTTFASYFLTDLGVAAAMSTLPRNELAALHALAREPGPVDIEFFGRLYKTEEDSWRRGTVTQRYDTVYKSVFASLVRKGVLLLWPGGPKDGDSKMERWRFQLPPAFVPSLPLPFDPSPLGADVVGESNADVFRPTLCSLARATVEKDIALTRGEILLEAKPFRARSIAAWARAKWSAALKVDPDRPSPIACVEYALALAGTRWVAAQQLAPLLSMVCPGQKADPAQVCEAGWQWGLLARAERDGETLYRRAEARTSEADFARELRAADEGVFVELEAVTYATLEALGRVSELRRAPAGKKGSPRLLAVPDAARLSDALGEANEPPAWRWLREHSPAFQTAFTQVTARWGKLVLHENLLVARVGELSLRVALTKSRFGASVVELPDGFVAFPVALRDEVERLVKKEGYVVRSVKAPGKG